MTTGEPEDFGGACVFEGLECEDAIECCESAPPGSDCPNTYPDNWSCVAGTCVHGGCTSQADCADLYTGLSCVTFNSHGWCAAACENDAECVGVHNMPGTECFDNPGGADYCRAP